MVVVCFKLMPTALRRGASRSLLENRSEGFATVLLFDFLHGSAALNRTSALSACYYQCPEYALHSPCELHGNSGPNDHRSTAKKRKRSTPNRKSYGQTYTRLSHRVVGGR